jgi:hypothetical protein
MCHRDMIKYTCGCVKEMEFFQCAERQGTNVKCMPVEKVLKREAANYCPNHLVNPTAARKKHAES